MAKEIVLTRGKVAKVSDEDYERVAGHKWCYDGIGYAKRKLVINGKHTSQLMHRFVIDAPPGWDVDHIDGDTLNNTRENLRLATRGQNNANSSVARGKSKYRGVYRNGRDTRWISYIKVNGKNIWLGTFENEEQAARAYQDAAQKAWGEFARVSRA